MKRNSVLIFLVKYILLMGIFLIIIGYQPIKNVIDLNGLYTQFIVRITAFLLKPFHIIKHINGSLIHLKNTTLDVKFGCNGLEAFFIYAAGVLSFPTTLNKKLKGLALGLLIIQVMNIVRIAGLCLSSIYLKQYFDYIHIYIAQGIMIALALIVFLLWINYDLPQD